MRIAIFSDVHANIDALETVLGHIDAQNVDALACLGDIVGYGGAPQECTTIIRERARWTVLGNHDAAVGGRMKYDYYYSAARDALDLHRELLDEENLRWLSELPMRVLEPDLGLQLTHGRPDVPDAYEYMFNDEHAQALLDAYDSLQHVNFIGHSHLTEAYRLAPESDEPIQRVTGMQIEIDPDARYVITVGSVGQPRDHDPRACYVIYDTDARRVEFFRLSYDVTAAAKRIWEQERLSAEFAKRLYLGI